MIGLVRNEWKKVFLPVLLTTVLLAIAMGVLSCTIYQNYVLHYDLEAWEVGTELFSLLYPLFVVVPLCWNLYYERKNNFLLYIMPRVKIKKYLTAKWIAYALGTLCIIVIPYILSAVFALYVKPPVVPFVENPFSHIFENAFIKTPLLYAVALSLWRGIVSLFVMTFGFVLALYCKNIFVILTGPFMYSILENFVLAILCLERLRLVVAFDPTTVNPEVVSIFSFFFGPIVALFTGCILFSISGRLNGGIAYERHILSAVSDHYYLTYFVLPIVLLSCFSFIDDDGEPVILRFQSYHSYFLKKWIGVGLIAVILTAVQTGAILLSGIGLPLGNEWNLAAGATEAELFSTLEQLFASPLQAFVCFTLYQLIGSWLIFGICMWIGHFTGRKWTIRIVIVLYVLSAVWIKLPAIQNIPLTSFNHLLILHHNFGEPARPWSTGFTLLLFMLTIMFSVRFAWRGHLPQLRLKCHGIAAYYSYELMTKRNILILLAVVVGITLYKGLGYGAAESDAEWIYSLFAGHGTGYFQVFPFLEMLITSGVPLYLLAAFVEHTVNGQSIFISVRAKSRRHLVKGILSVSTKFLIIYAFFWLMAGLIGASLFSTGLTIVSFRLMLYAVLMKCLDILVQYLIVLGIYIATRQVTIGFLVLVAGNLLCILPGNWVAYSPFGLSSLTRISVVEPGIGISAVSAFGIEAAILTLMIAGILMWGYKKILN